MKNFRRTFRQVLGSTLAASIFLCSAASGAAETKATWRPDAWVTAKTKMSLATDREVGFTYINVDTVNGRVTLHGKVYDEAERVRAEEVAVGVEGAVEVRNLLQVVPKPKMDRVKQVDAKVSTAVTAALDANTELEDSSIQVQSVNDGVVLLAGQASSLLAHLEAIRTASRVDGVRDVATEIETGDRLYDDRLWHDSPAASEIDVVVAADDAEARAESLTKKTVDSVKKTGAAVAQGTKDMGSRAAASMKNAGKATKDLAVRAKDATVEAASDMADATGNAASTTYGAVSDAWITSATKTKMLADSDVPALWINVDTSDGIVTLFGTVASENQRDAAVRIAGDVNGVVKVNDALQVDTSLATKTAGEDRKDDQIQQDIRDALAKQSRFSTAKIDVTVDSGQVELSGTAPNSEVKMAAAVTTRAVDGVRAVRNKIRVKASAAGDQG